MKKSKTFVELSKEMEVLSENAKGQLKGGFVVLSSTDLATNLKDLHGDCTNKNCSCTNKNCSK